MVDLWQLITYTLLRIFWAVVGAVPTDFRVRAALPSWLPTLVQTAAIVLLVAITAWYAFQTWRSTTLARRQMAFEIQRRHTDALQDRTGTWREHFPEVHPTRVSLPDGAPDADGERTPYPATLENDPYFEDLLENHAEDVAQLTTAIVDKVESYERKRSEFVANTDLKLDGRLWSLVEPNFYEWLFERIVLIERGVMDEQELKADLRDAFTAPRVENSATVYPGDTDPKRRTDVLVFHRTRSTAPNRDDEKCHRLSANRIVDVIDCLDGLAEYSTAVEASEVLADLESDVEELRRLVVRYDEMGRIPGDCEYVSPP